MYGGLVLHFWGAAGISISKSRCNDMFVIAVFVGTYSKENQSCANPPYLVLLVFYMMVSPRTN